MKIKYKTEEEIKIMMEGGKILSDVLKELCIRIKPGMTTNDVNEQANLLIAERGAEPSFTKVPGYRWATCLSVNNEIVHTPPSDKVLKEGDVFTIDIGVFYKGFHTDTSTTLIVGDKKPSDVVDFLETGKRALNKAIGKFRFGKKLVDVSAAIQEVIEGKGFEIIKTLTGHGVGRDLHEEPYIFGFVSGGQEDRLTIKNGLVVAIEVIYAKTTDEVVYDGEWSINTRDGSISACFEKTVAILNKKTVILT